MSGIRHILNAKVNANQIRELNMKKSVIALLVLLLVLVGIVFWVVGSTDAKHLEQQDISVDVKDTFEK